MKDPIVKAEFILPCGHVMRIANRLEGEVVEQVDITKYYDSTASVLAHWFKDRAARHRCELVTEENPMGLLPRERKT